MWHSLVACTLMRSIFRSCVVSEGDILAYSVRKEASIRTGEVRMYDVLWMIAA